MPSKYGFGNTRKKSPMPMYGKSQKNPVMMTKAQETLPEKLQAGIRAKEEKESGMKMYGKSPVKDDYSKAKKKNPNLDKLIATRKGAEKGSAEYNAAQNKINKAYGKGPTNRPTTTTPPPPATTPPPEKKTQGQKNVEYRDKQKTDRSARMAAAKAERNARRAKKNEAIAEKRKTRNEKVGTFVSGLKPKSKA